jgi:hypothetical protein
VRAAIGHQVLDIALRFLCYKSHDCLDLEGGSGNKAFDPHPFRAELYLRLMNALGLREYITDAIKFYQPQAGNL